MRRKGYNYYEERDKHGRTDPRDGAADLFLPEDPSTDHGVYFCECTTDDHERPHSYTHVWGRAQIGEGGEHTRERAQQTERDCNGYALGSTCSCATARNCPAAPSA